MDRVATPRVVALLSGGLDSTLAVRLVQQQGIEVEALHVRTPFDCCRAPAAQAAAGLGVRLTVLSVADDYVEIIRRPKFGYGRAVNPCVDCRVYLCRMARRMMEEIGACAVVTGEVLGQRPSSQKRRHLDTIEVHAGLEGRLLRPLCARLLAPTVPEREGLIDRTRLRGFNGQGRKPLIELARRLGVAHVPGPSSGCALAQPSFAPRVRALIELDPQATRADFELLNYGRHVRLDGRTKVVLGRNAGENAALRAQFDRHVTPRWALMEPKEFSGPSALLVGEIGEPALRSAASLVVRHARPAGAVSVEVWITHSGQRRSMSLAAAESTPQRDVALAPQYGCSAGICNDNGGWGSRFRAGGVGRGATLDKGNIWGKPCPPFAGSSLPLSPHY